MAILTAREAKQLIDDEGTLVVPGRYKEIEPHVARDIGKIRTLKLEEGVEVVAASAFSMHAELVSVVLPGTLCTIGEHAFSSCGLRQIVVPGSVAVISDCSFSHCLELQSVEISEGVKRIEGRAFADCRNLQRVVLPASISFISKDAFSKVSTTLGHNVPLIISASASSYAEKYAIENGYIPR